MELCAQIISLVAMAFNCLSYQQKRQKGILLLQLFGSGLFGISYFMLGALAGGLLNAVAVLRAVVFLNARRLRAEHPAWCGVFTAAYVASYVLIFTVFGGEISALSMGMELLPVMAMILSTVSFRYGKGKVTRRFALVCSPLWLIYNIYSMSVGAIACESLNLVSVAVGIYRHDRGEEKNS